VGVTSDDGERFALAIVRTLDAGHWYLDAMNKLY
jgi:hypothetical protein